MRMHLEWFVNRWNMRSNGSTIVRFMHNGCKQTVLLDVFVIFAIRLDFNPFMNQHTFVELLVYTLVYNLN